MELKKQTFGLNPIELKGGYKMKTISMLMVALLLFSAMPLVAAVNETVVDEDLDLVDAGVTPDSAFYGLERAMESLRLAFTRNGVEKVKLKIKYAEERLAETEQMIDENNTEAAEEAQEAHDDLLEEVQEDIDGLGGNGDNETSQEDLEDAVELELEAESHSEKVSRVKNRILERKMAGNMSAEQIAHLTAIFEKIISKAQEMEIKFEQKKGYFRIKYKVYSESSDEDLDEFESRVRSKFKEKNVPLDEVPQVVLDAAQEAAEGFVLIRADRETKDSVVVYKLKGEVGDQEYEMKIDEDGNLLKLEVEDEDEDEEDEEDEDEDEEDEDEDRRRGRDKDNKSRDDDDDEDDDEDDEDEDDEDDEDDDSDDEDLDSNNSAINQTA